VVDIGRLLAVLFASLILILTLCTFVALKLPTCGGFDV